MVEVKSIIFTRNNKSFIIDNKEKPILNYNGLIISINENQIIKYLNSLYRIINSWEHEYINNNRVDADIWTLLITYRDDSIDEYKGRNSYPYNFESLEELNYNLVDEVLNV